MNTSRVQEEHFQVAGKIGQLNVMAELGQDYTNDFLQRSPLSQIEYIPLGKSQDPNEMMLWFCYQAHVNVRKIRKHAPQVAKISSYTKYKENLSTLRRLEIIEDNSLRILPSLDQALFLFEKKTLPRNPMNHQLARRALLMTPYFVHRAYTLMEGGWDLAQSIQSIGNELTFEVAYPTDDHEEWLDLEHRFAS